MRYLVEERGISLEGPQAELGRITEEQAELGQITEVKLFLSAYQGATLLELTRRCPDLVELGVKDYILEKL